MSSGSVYTVLAYTAAVFSVLLNASPLRTVQKMREANTVGATNILFFAAQKWCSILWATYGVMRGSMPLLIANVIGNAVGSYAMMCFLFLAVRETNWGLRRLPATTLTATVATAAGFLCLSWGHLIAQVVLSSKCQAARGEALTGVEASVASIVMLSAPLSTVRHIIDHKDASSLSPYTTVFGFMNALLWVIAGSIVRDPVLVLPNAVCWVATCVQLYLIVRFRPAGSFTATVISSSSASAPPQVTLPGQGQASSGATRMAQGTVPAGKTDSLDLDRLL